jgi:hypothetical protein
VSALDKFRTFAESREPHSAVIRDGITYGDVREVFRKIERLQAAFRAWSEDEAWAGPLLEAMCDAFGDLEAL